MSNGLYSHAAAWFSKWKLIDLLTVVFAQIRVRVD